MRVLAPVGEQWAESFADGATTFEAISRDGAALEATVAKTPPTLRVGETARIAITEVDQRCVMITLDPASGTASPAVLRCVAQGHKGRAGVYGSVVTVGAVRVGDAVWLEG